MQQKVFKRKAFYHLFYYLCEHIYTQVHTPKLTRNPQQDSHNKIEENTDQIFTAKMVKHETVFSCK